MDDALNDFKKFLSNRHERINTSSGFNSNFLVAVYFFFLDSSFL